MGFQIIRPKQGKRPAHLAGITVSWRRRSNVSTMGVAVNIASAIVAELRWPRDVRLEVSYDPETNRVRLSPADHGFRLTGRDGTGTVCFPLDHVAERNLLAASLVRHEVTGQVLILHMPTWAWMPGFKAARDCAAVARKKAA